VGFRKDNERHKRGTKERYTIGKAVKENCAEKKVFQEERRNIARRNRGGERISANNEINRGRLQTTEPQDERLQRLSRSKEPENVAWEKTAPLKTSLKGRQPVRPPGSRGMAAKERKKKDPTGSGG